MVTYGIEAIGNFDVINQHVIKGNEVENRPIAFLFCNAFDQTLEKKGHIRKFHKDHNTSGSTDMYDKSQNGVDYYFADNVDLFLINTHGSHDKEGNIELVYNIKSGDWVGNSKYWRLGDKQLRWLLLAACDIIDKVNAKALFHIFDGLHTICSSYGHFRVGVNIGEDLAENLSRHGKTVADAWIDGVGDRSIFDNNVIVVAAEKSESVDPITGRTEWSLSTMDRDCLSAPVPNIANSDISWLSIKWREDHDVKHRRVQIT